MKKASFCLLLLLAACGPIVKEASYPDRNEGSDKILYSDQKRETIWGEGEGIASQILGSNKEKDGQGTSGLGVNSFLWRASLDTLSFIPVASADPFGGVILTDWYENPETPGERFKLNVTILDKSLRADGLRVAAFKQTLDPKGNWRDVKVSDGMAVGIENAILKRARELRLAQSPVKK